MNDESIRPPCLLGSLTRREFRERVQAGELQLCILPVAAIEQHLEHLAMEHDWRSVNIVAEAVAEALAPSVLVAQGIMVGISEHHMKHPGTLTLRPGTFLAVLNDLIRSLVHAGFKNVLVLNGHGGNMVPCQSNWDQFVREFQINLQFVSYWDVLTAEDAALLQGAQRMPEDLPGHAQEFETSIALARFPENVRHDAMKDQVDQSPSLAEPSLGSEMLCRITQRITEHARAMMNGDSVAAIPPFHP